MPGWSITFACSVITSFYISAFGYSWVWCQVPIWSHLNGSKWNECKENEVFCSNEKNDEIQWFENDRILTWFFLSLSALLYICDLLVNLKKHEGEFLFKLWKLFFSQIKLSIYYFETYNYIPKALKGELYLFMTH